MFVHLHCHSHYSFLRGVNPPEEIIAAAVEQKMPAVALTDTNGMYAAVPFYQAAEEAGVKPIVGVVLEVELLGARGRVARNQKLKDEYGKGVACDSRDLRLTPDESNSHSPLCCWRWMWRDTAICAS